MLSAVVIYSRRRQTAGKDRGRFPDGQTGAASWRQLSCRGDLIGGRGGKVAASLRVRWYDRGIPAAVGAFLASALCRSFLHGIPPALSLRCVHAVGCSPAVLCPSGGGGCPCQSAPCAVRPCPCCCRHGGGCVLSCVLSLRLYPSAAWGFPLPRCKARHSIAEKAERCTAMQGKSEGKERERK